MAAIDFSTYTLPEMARKDIEAFALHHAILVDVLTKSLSYQPDISPKRLLTKFANDVGLSLTEVQVIFRTLENINILRSENQELDDVYAYIESELGESSSKIWAENKDQIKKAIEIYSVDNPISICFKANRLSYNYEKIFNDAEILTDARPVFNDSGEKIVEYVISHTLVVKITQNRKTETIHLAMDAEDVLDLRKACERASIKAQTLRKSLSDHGVPAKVLNDNG